MRRPIAVLLAATGLLALPAAARATTYTVDPSAGSGCNGNTCRTISAAATAAGNNDTIDILAGTYAESPSFTQDGIIVQRKTGEGPVVITRASSGAAVAFSGTGATLGGVVVQSSGSGIATTGSLTLLDSYVVSDAGPALTASGAVTALTVRRSQLLSTSGASTAVDYVNGTTTPHSITFDSTIVSGGANGLVVKTAGANAGLVTGTLRHVTIAGQSRGILLDSSDAGGTGVTPDASIAVTATSSIVHGASRAIQHPAGTIPALDQRQTAALTFTDTDAPAFDTTAAGSGDELGTTSTTGTPSNTPDAQLFRNVAVKNLLLRADAPVIGIGTAPLGGESVTDVEGQPRTTGAASDRGADEFLNQMPTAALSAPATATTGTAVTFNGTPSSDPEATYGGGIKEYRWTFGDGATATTTTPTTSHAYTSAGTFAASLVVQDQQLGLSSASTPVQLTVTAPTPPPGGDGGGSGGGGNGGGDPVGGTGTGGVTGDTTPPSVRITRPAIGATLHLRKTVTKRVKGKRRRVKVRQAIRLTGTASDPSGVKTVELALRYAGKSARTAAGCSWFDGKLKLSTTSCSKPIYVTAKITDTTWSLTISRKAKLRAGVYELAALGTDFKGNRTTRLRAQDRTLIRFRIL